MRILVGLLGCLFVSPAFAEAPIVGGSTVPPGKWRDVVAVIARDTVCTGTLIAPDIVLTAGHCIAAGPIEVRTDTLDYTAPDMGDRIAVKWARAYPGWDQRYDIGVIMLEHVARGKARRVASACNAREALVPGALVHVVGFGVARADGGGDNTTLREADVPVIDPTCTMDLACEPSIAPHGEFMAGGNGTDSCFGDSGGPVFIDTPEGPALVGVVSRGLSLPGPVCGNGGVYVRADKVVSWIQSVTGTRLDRTTCPGRADGVDAIESGGCATTSGASPILGLLLLGGATWRRRARLLR
jgi:secreted trypsin-like serine protease